MGEPRASKTARDVTFSEAMSRMDSFWRWISFFCDLEHLFFGRPADSP
jgi:hypothetical protein